MFAWWLTDKARDKRTLTFCAQRSRTFLICCRLFPSCSNAAGLVKDSWYLVSTGSPVFCEVNKKFIHIMLQRRKHFCHSVCTESVSQNINRSRWLCVSIQQNCLINSKFGPPYSTNYAGINTQLEPPFVFFFNEEEKRPESHQRFEDAAAPWTSGLVNLVCYRQTGCSIPSIRF